MNIPKYIEQYRKDLKLKNYAENTIIGRQMMYEDFYVYMPYKKYYTFF